MFWNFIGWLFIGAIIGWLASKIMHGKGGLIRNIVLGVAGSVVGGWLAEFAHRYGRHENVQRVFNRRRRRVRADFNQPSDRRQEINALPLKQRPRGRCLHVQLGYVRFENWLRLSSPQRLLFFRNPNVASTL